ncbi:MAG: hypothetical protein ACRD4V_04380, partial [Candidatus Acidiferrales bacterium]
LAQLHFWTSLGFITVLFFAYPATHPASPAGPFLQSALWFFFLSMLGLIAAQIILLINLVWSFFRGETIRIASPPS